MHLNLPHILTLTILFTTTFSLPMFSDKTCGLEEDLACYSDGSNGKRSADPIPNPAPMFPEGTCGPEEDLACYPDGSNGKRSPTSPKLPSITASRVTIPPLGAPTGGTDGGGYLRLRRSPPDVDAEPDSIVIGSKPKRSPEKTEDPPTEDVGAYDEEKRSLSLDAAGHPILTGDNYPSLETKRTLPELALDRYNYPIMKREAIPGLSPLKKLEIDGDYPKPDNSSYPVRKRERAKRMRKLDMGDYAPPDDSGVYGPDY
jgi:hypothetical protein